MMDLWNARFGPRRYSRKRGIGKAWKAIDTSACAYCGRSLTETTLTLDHVVPLSRGGVNAPHNIVAACGPCNERKADWLIAEMCIPHAAWHRHQIKYFTECYGHAPDAHGLSEWVNQNTRRPSSLGWLLAAQIIQRASREVE